MSSKKRYLTSVFANGFVVIILLSIPLFYCRLYCTEFLLISMPHDARCVRIKPSGLLPARFEITPEVLKSTVTARIDDTIHFPSLGFAGYVDPVNRERCLYYYDERNDWLYLDKQTGLLNYSHTFQTRKKSKLVRQIVHLYAGPEGVGKIPDRSLGRFNYILIAQSKSEYFVYDKKLRQFFSIDFHNRTIIKSEPLKDAKLHNPLDIGRIKKQYGGTRGGFIRWKPPEEPVSEEEARAKGIRRKRNGRYYASVLDAYWCSAGRNILVLDKSGRIDLLDRKTLTFVGTAGRLPAPRSLFTSEKCSHPQSLLAYDVYPLTYYEEHIPDETGPCSGTYAGLCVSAINREGTTIALAVFDPNGKLIARQHSELQDCSTYGRSLPSCEAYYFARAWAPFHTAVLYLIENLQPPALSVAAFLAGETIEATAGHRALFILPNSFIAMIGRADQESFSWQILIGFLIICPSLILSAFLAWRGNIDAGRVGLSKNAKALWLVGTIAFGLVAYITYRLTRPRITLVTCANCGKMRRPDQDNCHHCNDTWKGPELAAPAWRVVDQS